MVYLQCCLRVESPERFHPVGCGTAHETRTARLLPKVPAFTCPTHYGGRLATMPSADFWPITSGVAATRADRVTLGSGGHSAAFTVVLKPAPMATSVTSGFYGYSNPFEMALSSTSMVTQPASWADLPE